MSSSPRVESARRRVRVARYVIGGTAAALFAGAGVAVRMAHPGTHGHHSAAAAQAAIPIEPSAFQNAVVQSSSTLAPSASSSSSSSSISPAPAPSAPVVVQSSGS